MLKLSNRVQYQLWVMEVKVTKVAKIIFTNDNNVSMSQPQSQGKPKHRNTKNIIEHLQRASDEN